MLKACTLLFQSRLPIAITQNPTAFAGLMSSQKEGRKKKGIQMKKQNKNTPYQNKKIILFPGDRNTGLCAFWNTNFFLQDLQVLPTCMCVCLFFFLSCKFHYGNNGG